MCSLLTHNVAQAEIYEDHQILEHHMSYIQPILKKNLPKKNNKKIIIVTDAEAILGIGDQGYGGIEICYGKGKVDTLCSGIDPNCILQIMLDVGTNNKKHLEDPHYKGLKELRPRGKEYDLFIEAFIYSVKNVSPHIFLHWEDFTSNQAHSNLKRADHLLLTFNDDMQGTAMITLATTLVALQKTGKKL